MIQPGEYRNQRSGKLVHVARVAESGQVIMRRETAREIAFGSMLAFAETYEPSDGWPEGFVDSLRPAQPVAIPPRQSDELQEQIDFIRWVMS